MSIVINSSEFKTSQGQSIDLSQISTSYDIDLSEQEQLGWRKRLRTLSKSMQKNQEKLFAEKSKSLLVILQGMDTSGKDSTIKYVCSGINPQGLRVHGFGVPTTAEFEYTYLHRFWDKLPPRGFIHVFNRSYYEEVTVVRVHPHLLRKRMIPHEDTTGDFWGQRISEINDFESHLAANGTQILKIFLHISPQEQMRRIMARLQNPNKLWKFDPSDVEERTYWDQYLVAYSEAISMTNPEVAPWYVFPADYKPITRLLVADAISKTLADMKPKFPKLQESQQKVLNDLKLKLGIGQEEI
ncbi:MAG: polyphosphate kinase 2 family protein [Gammaproteobacteria bacterium]|nr:polyphosphate kinase 2 family protein [Gammaproteobacteria bacterium]